jgi:hypothetical protein
MVFFSFHFDRDAWRVGQVRNSVITMQKSVFLDKADWESVKRNGDAAIERWIDDQLKGASVTVVLIGRETSQRRWVGYELIQSWAQNKGILGIYIHNCKDKDSQTDQQGNLDFNINFKRGSESGTFSQRFRTYDWLYDNGRNNIETWIEKAVVEAGR